LVARKGKTMRAIIICALVLACPANAKAQTYYGDGGGGTYYVPAPQSPVVGGVTWVYNPYYGYVDPLTALQLSRIQFDQLQSYAAGQQQRYTRHYVRAQYRTAQAYIAPVVAAPVYGPGYRPPAHHGRR